MKNTIEDYQQLDLLRETVRKERRFVDEKPSSRNIINLTLATIKKRYGNVERTRVIRTFDLKRYGWQEE